jgi:hypothetical protein
MKITFDAVLVVVTIFVSLISLIVLPDFIRYHNRVDRMEQRLRAHCSQWVLEQDPPYLPLHELLVQKCFPKHPKAVSQPSTHNG